MSNSAEGFERGGDNEFLQFQGIAKGPAGEVRAQLYVALDARLMKEEDFTSLYRLTSDISRLISVFMKYLAEYGHRENKFKAGPELRLKQHE